MIEIIKDASMSIYLKLDLYGIQTMIEYVENIKLNSEMLLQIIYSGNERYFSIVIDEDTDELIINKEIIKIYMAYEECEYFLQRLKEAVDNGYFFPAEICERNYKKKNITLLCEVV